MTVQAPAPERSVRGPGCGDGCQVIKALVPGVFGRSELLLHDPAAHEAYVYARIRGRVDVLETGPLRLDRLSQVGWLAGRRLILSLMQTRLLFLLAARAGEIVAYDEIFSALWPEWPEADWFLAGSILRATLSRLRARLGAAGSHMIVTHAQRGLELVLAERGQPAPAELVRRDRLGGRWAMKYDRCIDCRSTERRHVSHGRCTTCTVRAWRKKERP